MINEYIEIVEQGIEEALAARSIPELLRSAMKYSVIGGGKRLRPCLCLASCKLMGGIPETALPIAVGIELIHSYSLVHDDLPCMDNDDMRRGKPSTHKAFGEAEAVLTGDALLNYAFEWMLSKRPNSGVMLNGYIKAVEEVACKAGPKGMIAGQSIELSGDMETGRASIEQVQALKTGALIEAAAVAGALVAGADEEKIAAIRKFAQNYGILFQVTDDMLDPQDEVCKNYALNYGMEKAKEKAETAANAAKNALHIFGNGAVDLIELVDATLVRTV